MDPRTGTTAGLLRSVAQDAGITAWVHATRIGGPDDGPDSRVTLAGDEPVAIASLYKLPLAAAWADLTEAGVLQPGERLLLAGDRTPGPTGVAMLLDDVSMSMRDTVRMMLAVSDNAAGDAILDAVGPERLEQWRRHHGFHAIRIRHGSGDSLRIVQRETGAASTASAERALATIDRDVMTTEYDPILASSSTAAQICEILAHVWTGGGPAHANVRDALAHQAWRHRIGSGFPHDDVVIHGKTGTLGRLRHEAAVVAFPAEYPIAVTVLTRAARPERHQPRVDAAIGELARLAVTPLRSPAPTP